MRTVYLRGWLLKKLYREMNGFRKGGVSKKGVSSWQYQEVIILEASRYDREGDISLFSFS